MSNVLTSHSCAWQTHDRSLLAPSPSSPRSSSVLTLHSFVSQQAPPAPISNQLQSINLRTVPRAAVAQWGLFAFEKILRCLWKPPDAMPPVSLPQGGDGGLHMFLCLCLYFYSICSVGDPAGYTNQLEIFLLTLRGFRCNLYQSACLKGQFTPESLVLSSGMLSYLCIDIILMSWSVLKDISCRESASSLI